MPEYIVGINVNDYWEAVVEAACPEQAERRAEIARDPVEAPEWLVSPWKKIDSESEIVSVEKALAKVR